MALYDYESNLALMNYTIGLGKTILPISRQQLFESPNTVVNLILEEWEFDTVGINATLPLTPLSGDDTKHQYTTYYIDEWDTSSGGYLTQQSKLSDNERIMQTFKSYPGSTRNQFFTMYQKVSGLIEKSVQKHNKRYNFPVKLNNYTSVADFMSYHDVL